MKTKILNLINNAEKIAILPHISIDGDTLGSSLALCEYIKSLGKSVTIYVGEEIPKTLKFLNADVKKSSKGEADLAIAVDCADKARIGKRSEIFDMAKHTVCIDHHISNTGYADVNLVQNCAATAEIVFGLIPEEKITSYMADCLMTAIITDTGAFRYSNTESETHIIASKLLEYGAKSHKICEHIYENKPFSAMRLEAWCVENVKLCHGGKTAIVKLLEKTISDLGAKDEDCSEISSLLRSIEGVEVSALLREKGDSVKISMRSASLDLTKITEQIGGGGHEKAAGATMYEGIDECARILEELIGKQWNSAE